MATGPLNGVIHHFRGWLLLREGARLKLELEVKEAANKKDDK